MQTLQLKVLKKILHTILKKIYFFENQLYAQLFRNLLTSFIELFEQFPFRISSEKVNYAVKKVSKVCYNVEILLFYLLFCRLFKNTWTYIYLIGRLSVIRHKSEDSKYCTKEPSNVRKTIEVFIKGTLNRYGQTRFTKVK
jgi:hypothetical protein